MINDVELMVIINLIFRLYFTALYLLTVQDICGFQCVLNRNFKICYIYIVVHWRLYECNVCTCREYLIYWAWSSTILNHCRLIRVACVATNWGSKLSKIYVSFYKWTKKCQLSKYVIILYKILTLFTCITANRSTVLTPTHSMGSELPKETLSFQVKTQTT